MPHKYKELLCRLAVKILQRYNQGHSDNLQRFTWLMVDGKYYAIDSLEVVQETGYKKVEIDAYDFDYFIQTYSVDR